MYPKAELLPRQLFNWFGMLAAFALAADTPYDLLEPIPEVGSQVTSFGDYISGVYTTILILAVVLAVIMVVVGGIQYSASSMSPGLKEDGKKKIWGAIGGLLLALFSVIILQTINSSLISSDFPISTGDSTWTGPNTGDGCGGRGTCGGPTETPDSQGRQDLLGAGVDSFDLANCADNGFVSPCGYFEGMTPGLVSYVTNINSRCPLCSLVARDATGPGHANGSDHYAGEKIDFAPTDSLNNFIRNNPSQFFEFGRTTKTFNGETFVWITYEDRQTGARWMYEDYPGTRKDHWDVDSKVP
jgi:hypothetical protein